VIYAKFMVINLNRQLFSLWIDHCFTCFRR